MVRRCVVVCLAFALVAGACGDEGDSGESTTTSTTAVETTTTSVETTALTASATGVTPEAIRLGFLGIDFDTLRELGLVDINRGDFDTVVAAFVDDINDRGGIHGRMIEATTVEVSPVDLIAADEACVELTEDAEVFAVIGGLVGPTASANPCFAVRESTIMIGGAPTMAERAELTAPWISTGVGPNRHFPAALTLMYNAGLLDGPVGVTWDVTEERAAEEIVLPHLASLGVDVVGRYIQGTTEGDAAAGTSEWQGIAERIRVDGAETIVMLEATATFGSQQLIDLDYDGQLLIVDGTGVTGTIGARSQVPLEALGGIIGTGWLDSDEAWQQEVTQDCVAVFERANPDITVLQSSTVPPGEPNWSQNIAPLCNYLRIFERAAIAAGPNLTHDTFLAGVEAIGSFELVGQGPALLEPGKHDAANAIRLTQFDPTDLPSGGTKPYGPMLTLEEISAS